MKRLGRCCQQQPSVASPWFTTAKNVEQKPKSVWLLRTGCGTKHLRLRFWVPGQWGGGKLPYSRARSDGVETPGVADRGFFCYRAKTRIAGSPCIHLDFDHSRSVAKSFR